MTYRDPDERRRKQREQKKQARMVEPERFRAYEERSRQRNGAQPYDFQKSRDAELLRRYNIGSAQYERLLVAQGGVCAMCADPPGQHHLHVDHDHACCPGRARSCGRCIRGLLCAQCNTGLSNVERSGFLDAATAYLARPPALGVLTHGLHPTLWNES